jgi:hypothetical protein
MVLYSHSDILYLYARHENPFMSTHIYTYIYVRRRGGVRGYVCARVWRLSPLEDFESILWNFIQEILTEACQ